MLILFVFYLSKRFFLIISASWEVRYFLIGYLAFLITYPHYFIIGLSLFINYISFVLLISLYSFKYISSLF
ncbi:unnamed protein product [Rhizophagus irregularis]|nr:unnamed protein product [Rhizophagus irregularis]CAB5198787.1 unnamed protein product [Rhizophagus irregularis]